MKKLVLAFMGAALFMAANLTVSAQNYQPFRQGLTYHYIAQDSIYSLRVDSVKVVAGDSVFVFNQIARKGGPVAGPVCQGSPTMPMVYAISAYNQFGRQLRKKPNGDFIFETTYGQPYLLKTKVGIGQSWLFNSMLNITATLASKGVELIATVSDSVFTYNLSNGKLIKLSKNYGLISSPNFIHYTDPYFIPKDLAFYALPEKGIGRQISGFQAIFDFQPGDEFMYYTEAFTNGSMPSLCTETWMHRKIISRQMGPANSLVYGVEEQQVIKGHGHPSSPSPFCQTPSTTTLSNPRVYLWTIHAGTDPITDALTSGFHPNLSNNGKVVTGIYRATQYNQREQIAARDLRFDVCSQAFYELMHSAGFYRYAVGLGMVFTSLSPTGYGGSTVLLAYKKGIETWGNWQSLGQIMSNKKELQPVALKAFPNPFTSEVSLQFTHSFSAGKVSFSVSNVLGQEVLKREITVSSGQENRLELGQLPKGMYVLKAGQNGKVFSTRLVKE